MNTDPNKWTSTLPVSNTLANDEKYMLDGNRWVKTIPKKNLVSTRQKYSILATVFILGLFVVSTIKNETRELQKEISNLTASVNKLKFNIHQSTVEHEFLTSPENISFLAKKYLEYDFSSYKSSQIGTLNGTKKIKGESEITKTKSEKIKNTVKLKTIKIVKKKKEELKKLQELYSKPEELPDVIKVRIAKKIEKTKNDIQTLYSNPEKAIDVSKMQKWAGIQIVKVFLGIPIVPGR